MNSFRSQKLAGLIIVFLLVFTGCNPPKSPPTLTTQKTSTVPSPTLTALPPSAYTLQRPEFQQLANLISAIRAQEEQNRYDPENEWRWQIISDGISSQDGLISADLQRYYADNMPNASQYIENTPDEWADMFSLPSVSIQEILFKHSVVDYFNEKQIRFADKEEKQFSSLIAKAYMLDTNKAADETTWLVQIDLTKQDVRFWLALVENKNGKYKVIPNGMGLVYLTISDSSTELVTGIDINDDRKNDVVLLRSYYFAGGLTKTLLIYTISTQGIFLLDRISMPKPPPIFGEKYESEYEIGDHNHDGLPDIQITSPEFELFDCSWEQRIIVQFKDIKRTDQTIGGEIPNKPECLLARMLKSNKPEEMVSLLESAKANLKPNASSDLRSWIQLRLAMLYYAQGKDQQAIQELDAITKFPKQGKGGFQRAVQDAYQQVALSPLRVCEILNNVAYQKDGWHSENFSSDIDIDLAGFGAYPITFSPVPSIVCPYTDIINLRLQRQKLDNDSSPNKTFASLGLQLSSLYEANLDADDDPEWIGMLGKDTWKRLIVIDRANGIWQVTDKYRQYFSNDAASDLQVKKQDVTGDGQPEVIISFTYDPKYRDKCRTGRDYYLLEIMDMSNTDNPELVSKSFDCVEQSPLKTLSTQAIIDLITEMKNVDPIGEVTYPAWAKFQAGPQGQSTTLLNDVDELEKLVLTNTQPTQAQAEIKTILASLPENDSAADILRERLLYLSGYSYELQGDQEKAIGVYLNLIKEYPQSLWSKLAQSRLPTK